jgi:hypothetical protein
MNCYICDADPARSAQSHKLPLTGVALCFPCFARFVEPNVRWTGQRYEIRDPKERT